MGPSSGTSTARVPGPVLAHHPLSQRCRDLMFGRIDKARTQRLEEEVPGAWEPYFVASRMTSRGLLPRYSELFTGRFRNKCEWVATLRVMGFQFYWLATHFLVHKTHPSHAAWSFWEAHANRMIKAAALTVREVQAAMGLPAQVPASPPAPQRPRAPQEDDSTSDRGRIANQQQERHWSSHVQHYDRWLDEQQYCIKWCKVQPAANQSRDLHPDFPPNSTARQHALSLPPYRGQFQRIAERALNVTCCHVCTAKCFATVVETRNQSFRGDDVTLVTVATPGRFRTLERTRQLWSGPMVVLSYSVVRPVFLQNGTPKLTLGTQRSS